MRRHVIKGRGKNRGKYLCWALMAPEKAATPDGFVWLSEQRKAARWADPQYKWRTWETARAELHNGYFVKLVAPASFTATLIRELRAYITDHAAGAPEAVPCYWFCGDVHAGEDYCWGCAKRLVDDTYASDPKRFAELYGACEDKAERYRAAIDGGFDVDHDSPPYCERCDAKLSGYITDYGADEQIAALTGNRAPDFDDAEGWAALDHALVNVSDDDPRWRKIARVVDAARAEEGRARMEGRLEVPEGI